MEHAIQFILVVSRCVVACALFYFACESSVAKAHSAPTHTSSPSASKSRRLHAQKSKHTLWKRCQGLCVNTCTEPSTAASPRRSGHWRKPVPLIPSDDTPNSGGTYGDTQRGSSVCVNTGVPVKLPCSPCDGAPMAPEATSTLGITIGSRPDNEDRGGAQLSGDLVFDASHGSWHAMMPTAVKGKADEASSYVDTCASYCATDDNALDPATCGGPDACVVSATAGSKSSEPPCAHSADGTKIEQMISKSEVENALQTLTQQMAQRFHESANTYDSMIDNLTSKKAVLALLSDSLSQENTVQKQLICKLQDEIQVLHTIRTDEALSLWCQLMEFTLDPMEVREWCCFDNRTDLVTPMLGEVATSCVSISDIELHCQLVAKDKCGCSKCRHKHRKSEKRREAYSLKQLRLT